MKVQRLIFDEMVVCDRLYISFACWRKGFLSECRRVIGLDGSFLKGKIKGKILATVGKDGNNQMFPICWAVVKVENSNTWSWFIEILRKDHAIGEGDGWTFIFYQQKPRNTSEASFQTKESKGNERKIVGDEPEPSFMTNKKEGFMKQENHYITRTQLPRD
ncbi:uncharacterized protein LOC105636496 [Jatropha curcas]|uniref:uncharacterized protein LOC105636496 n=1 Tax=Jatropha curcas TaxID=180498 RepID=UPI0005FAD202|nr:uncharacterized protein LOC105636496 [Jatropha curcas]XP_012075166.1 uncharacterized protein LOC105636496 [Jatropha curcas]